MPPGIIKDPGHSPGTIQRADTGENIQFINEYKYMDKPCDFDIVTDSYVIYDIETINCKEIDKSIDLAVNIRTHPTHPDPRIHHTKREKQKPHWDAIWDSEWDEELVPLKKNPKDFAIDE